MKSRRTCREEHRQFAELVVERGASRLVDDGLESRLGLTVAPSGQEEKPVQFLVVPVSVAQKLWTAELRLLLEISAGLGGRNNSCSE